ncbi:MAG TPA: class I tRNA ligase family protein, partial [Gammaproteobacteria bacterium]|nr:class I tRNA ligase family protein [Gammaproteobacteria bacterium]
YADRYSLDAVRWFLTTQGPLGANDADFAHARFIEVYNADLANSVGNSMSRVGNMIGKYFDGEITRTCNGEFGFEGGKALQLALKALENAGKGADDPSRTFDFAKFTSQAVDDAIDALARLDLEAMLDHGRSIVRYVDDFISYCAPFTLAKQLDTLEHADKALATILYSCAEGLRIASLLLYPAMPDKMAGLWRDWGCTHLRDPGDMNSGFVGPLRELAAWTGEHSIRVGQTMSKGEALFMRADASEPAPVAETAS